MVSRAGNMGGGVAMLGFAMLGVVALSCGRTTKPADLVTPADATKPEDPGVTGAAAGGAELPPFTYAPGKPGPAYFAVRHEGVVMLDGGTFTKLEGSPTERVQEITQGRDGGMYLLGDAGVMRLEGTELRLVAATPSEPFEGLLDFAVDRDGTIWATGWKGVSFWNGSTWTTEGEAVLGPDAAAPHGLALDGRSRVWLVSLSALLVREDGKWSRIDTSPHWTSPPAYADVVTGPGGVAFAAATDGLLELSTPKELRKTQVGNDILLETLGASPTGVLGLRYNVDEVVRIGVDGTKTRWQAKRDFAGLDIDEVTPDDAGRLWVATDVGVTILGPGDPPGKQSVEWRSGRVPELAGKVYVIGVAGTGPVLPSEVGPVQTGGLAGKLVKGGKVLARTAVEICPAPRLRSETTPCAESATRIETTTDARGRFAVKDVPLGQYGLAAKVGPTWHVVYGGEYRVRERGRDHDVGEIQIKPKPERQASE